MFYLSMIPFHAINIVALIDSRLPTGGGRYTPLGQPAGLAVASALVTLGSPPRPATPGAPHATEARLKRGKGRSQHPDTCIWCWELTTNKPTQPDLSKLLATPDFWFNDLPVHTDAWTIALVLLLPCLSIATVHADAWAIDLFCYCYVWALPLFMLTFELFFKFCCLIELLFTLTLEI